MTTPVPVLLITGPIGAGKTSVAGEASHLLAEAGVAHAVVDVDALTECYPPPPHDPFNDELAMRNLAAVWRNYRAAGAERLILARVIEARAELDRYREAVPGARILVMRLRAPLATLSARVARREAGSGLDWHLRRAAVLAAQMDRDALEDVLVETDGRSVADVAREILHRAGWLTPSGAPIE